MPARATVAVLAVILVALPGFAHASGGLEVAATLDGTTATVTGTVTVAADGPFVRLADDPAGDALVPDAGQLGSDLTSFHARTLIGGDLVLRWVVSGMPSATTGSAGFVYSLVFTVDGATSYHLTAARISATEASTETAGWLSRCLDPQCLEGGTSLSHDLPVVFDPAGDSITVRIAANVLALQPGSVISALPVWSPHGGLFIAVGDINAYETLNDGAPMADYVYGLTVRLAVAPPGTDPTTLIYTRTASVEGTSFSGSIPAAPGRAVFAKACYGSPDNCLYGESLPL